MTVAARADGRSAADFAATAVRAAVADAGLRMEDVDGLIVSCGRGGGVDITLARELGLGDLGILTQMAQAGSTANAQVQMACLAVRGGLASTVVCVHADAPLQPSVRTGETYRRPTPAVGVGLPALALPGAPRTATAGYALAARRHMAHYGTTSEQFGAVAVAQREWASRNPLARFREPMTIADHQASREIVDPLRLFDCCMVSNGAVAVVVTSADRSHDLARPGVHVWGWAQTHPSYRMARDSSWGLRTGAAVAGPKAMKRAGVGPDDIDVRQIYDCFTYTVLVTLEDYGFCEKGEGGALAESGALAPGGRLPTNTGGGQLSSFYLWGMTPLSEAVLQVRGTAGDRQLDRHDVAIVSGNGGILAHHSTLVLGAGPR
ncbi:MAG: thiolase family protein [Pseudonocardia sp.]|nr:thiolase family protein [Pseudonocardia sp.]ODU27376.1 MAG: sterol carrier protein [Pseudonocardia sp. SCN 72-51]ODV09020.1 MAG: sterol carrier protein [Pseudonocardia sp. SCN 73-27]